MEKPKPPKINPQVLIAELISKVSKGDFGETALEFLSSVARIENFGAYHISDLANPSPVLSFWSGHISDYWFQRDADVILGTPEIKRRIVSQIHEAPLDGVHIDRWHPGDDEGRKAIYARNGIIERIAVSSKDGRSGLRSFYLRSTTDGWFSEEEYVQFCDILPIVHRLIEVRHQIVGTAVHRMRTGPSASRLRDCNVPVFSDLSPREADVCDLLIDGRSVAATALELAVSEATVRTLRGRAYRKLSVGSATQLMALFVRVQADR